MWVVVPHRLGLLTEYKGKGEPALLDLCFLTADALDLAKPGQ